MNMLPSFCWGSWIQCLLVNRSILISLGCPAHSKRVILVCKFFFLNFEFNIFTSADFMEEFTNHNENTFSESIATVGFDTMASIVGSCI